MRNRWGKGARLALICWGCLHFIATGSAQTPPQEEPAAVLALKTSYNRDPEFKQMIDAMLAQVATTVEGKPNPWRGKSADDLFHFVQEWHYFLPLTHDGLTYIRKFQALYADNPAGLQFIRSAKGRAWVKQFVEGRGQFMDSAESTALIEHWKSDPRIHVEDYQEPLHGYQSFNQFFTRELKPGVRPIDRPEDDSVLVSPADCIVQIMDLDLTVQSQLSTKGTEQLNIKQMLGGSAYADSFVGGMALRCILEPTSYHHYHAPVSGVVLEARENVQGPYFEERIIPSAARHRRGYLIIDTKGYGKVAMVAIGLATISSVTFESKFAAVDSSQHLPITKGEKIGHFSYGGSMVYILLQANKLQSLGVKQGQQIGVFDRVAEKN